MAWFGRSVCFLMHLVGCVLAWSVALFGRFGWLVCLVGWLFDWLVDLVVWFVLFVLVDWWFVCFGWLVGFLACFFDLVRWLTWLVG